MAIVLAQNPNVQVPAQVKFEPRYKVEEHFECKITFHSRYGKVCEEILKCLNEGEMDALSQNTQFGDLIRCGRGFNLSGQIIWYMVLRQANLTDSNNEFWMIVNQRPVRFSKLEFALLTGLRFARGELRFPESDSFIDTHFKGVSAVSTEDVLARMQVLKKKKKRNDRVSMPLVQLAALYFAADVLCPSWHMSDSIDSNILKLASDWESFRSFPWGNLAYNLLLRNLKKDMRPKAKKVINKDVSPTHSIGGFVHPLQVLAYECFPGIASRYVERKEEPGLPLARMCRWSVSKWNPKKSPSYSVIKSYAEASEDIFSCLTPTEEENAAMHIRDGYFEDDCAEPVTEHISGLLSRGMKVICTSSPSRAPPSPPHTSPPHTSPPHPSPTHPSPTHPSPPHTSHTHPSPSHPSTSTSIILRELREYMDLKFESLESRIDARLAQVSNEISILDGKVQTVCDLIKKDQENTTEPLKRPRKASEGVMKRRKYIDIHQDEDEDVAEPSHLAKTPMMMTTDMIVSQLATTIEAMASSFEVPVPDSTLPVVTSAMAVPVPDSTILVVTSPMATPCVPLKRVVKESKFLVTPFTGPGTDTPPSVQEKGKMVAQDTLDLFSPRHVSTASTAIV